MWVETDQPCEVDVLGRRARTFAVCGHHYALVCIEGLEPATIYPYEVALDGHTVWPDTDAATFPPSSIRTRASDDHDLRIAFGSCRVAYPHERPFSLRKDDNKRGREVDALYAMALRMRHQDPDRWPDLLLWLGDQVYADEISPGVREFIDGRPPQERNGCPTDEVADFEEYARLYWDSWRDPAIRWLISTVPSEARCGVRNWQSSNSAPAWRKAATSHASATFDASLAKLNIDSPQNARAKPTP